MHFALFIIIVPLFTSKNYLQIMLTISNLSFSYEKEKVLSDVNFKIQQGENISLIGESGCGKSTLLKLIYGLYNLDSGEIIFNGKRLLGPEYNLVPGHDDIKYLAQDFDLMPYTTVAENVGKFISNVDKEFKNQRVAELLSMVEMTEYADKKAKFLSGGEQQRVALARVLAVEPKLLLLDEPFSNIDSFRKGSLRRNLFSYLKSKNISCIVATHDSTDALSFSDKTMVLKKGKVQDFGASAKLFLRPKNKYIASLYGEVNTIALSELMTEYEGPETILVYPHELFPAEDSPLVVVVKECYFKGNGYLIKGAHNKREIFFDYATALPINEEISLSTDVATIKMRL